MPGHSSAAIAAYPSLSCFPEEPTKNYFPKNGKWAGDSTGKQVQQAWGIYSDVFCAGKEETFKFLQDVMDEILPLFPGKYIHIGGDECPKANWQRCPNCQQRIKDNKLKDEHELQSYFIQRMEKYINSKGKTLIGWDEILEGGLAPNAVVMSWRGEKGGIEAAKEKHEVIMTPTSHVYFDYSQTENEDSLVIGGYLPVEKVYSYEPIPAELNPEQAKYVLGAQANVWTEYMNNPRKVEYMLFPRLTALSEVLWSPKENRDWQDFEKRLPALFKRYDLWKANYSKAFYDLKAVVLPSPDNNGVLWKLESKLNGGIIRYARDVSSLDLTYTEPIKINNPTSLSARLYLENKFIRSVNQQFHFNKATGKKITLNIPPASAYRGDGAFTLVNGVWNEKGLAKAKEFLGFSSTDCEAIIDLGKEENFSSVIVHAYRNEASWIWRPLTVEVFLSADGKNFSSIGLTDDFTETKSGNGILKVEFITASPVRFVKVVVKNWGEIHAGNPGEGNKAWLFVDEIEIN
jgi:hexosaminidase